MKVYAKEVMALKVIGLCGGSGSGKGAVSELFLRYGIPSIDTDEVYHELTAYMSQCLLELVSHFGSDIIENGALNRAALAKLVFSDGVKTRLDELNAITHKHILAKTREVLAKYRADGVAAAIVDAPLLFESGFNEECDIIISVIADIDTRISRIIERDGITREAALRRIASQKNDNWLKERSDFVIYNDNGITDLEVRVAEIAKKILA